MGNTGKLSQRGHIGIMSNEMRVHGPPGTGKTRKLAEEIVPNLATKYGREKIMLTSFTKAAAKELAARIDMGESEITGTLHSICFHALKHPALTEDKLGEWDKLNPGYHLKGAQPNSTGPDLYAKYQILRNKMIPEADWPKPVQSFSKRWKKWKEEFNLLDFMDLIEQAGNQLSPPGSPSAIVIDEAQDFTRLEMSTLRRWASQVREFWVVGDDDQTLYTFAGADPRNMLLPELPPEQKIILKQSYRIPRSVHHLADKIIKRVTYREPKEYEPKDEEGSVTYSTQTMHDSDWIIKKALSLPGTSMILASYHKILFPIVKALRDSGVPFSNPWRPEETTWNPLNTNGAATLTDFLDSGEDSDFDWESETGFDYWNTRQFLSFAAHLRVGDTGLIRKQGKVAIEQLTKIYEENPETPGLHTCREYINQVLSPDAIEPALKRDLDWLLANLIKAKQTTIAYPVRILKNHGKDALGEQPRIFVGTIHSVKGAGADNVFLFPDIPFPSHIESKTKEGRENLCRLFYVGVTRTKQNLFVMSKATNFSFQM
jgi:DNA helicase II / ATP-dependent DNA helicase PcrA